MAISDKFTEMQNPATMNIDKMNACEILQCINREDQGVPFAVEKAIPAIEEFVYKVVESFRMDGKLYYVGAGTSGRLGVLDASEIPPTYSAPHSLVQGIMCGGLAALITAVEGAEDEYEEGVAIVDERGITNKDCILGITTSGMAAYVHGALKRAKEIGATTGLLICNEYKKPDYVDILIKTIVGPEVITGSTRMKAGTATKLILNMITTTSMVLMHKTYGNLMVDLMTTNKKLWDRGARIIKHCTGIEYNKAMDLLIKAGGRVKVALVMASLNIPFEEAEKRLQRHDGSLRETLDEEGVTLNL
ncbi:MAG: N-acetylmuramic acid 6-phosphate etherase [Candidatus Marinimicrobia bacterium]|nr:N-acetylmuramic acid 6-phosphate etherase [Candidatus Neomarinimicrobiota bacterium]MDD5581644.1 N-acetylmuramic acid 6-phosphate etherase [Candidatus Neomarinimicrobiota bacterium]